MLGVPQKNLGQTVCAFGSCALKYAAPLWIQNADRYAGVIRCLPAGLNVPGKGSIHLSLNNNILNVSFRCGVQADRTHDSAVIVKVKIGQIVNLLGHAGEGLADETACGKRGVVHNIIYENSQEVCALLSSIRDVKFKRKKAALVFAQETSV